MIKIIIFLVGFFYTSFSFAEIDIKKCDNISDKAKKITCLTKLRATAVSQNAKDKLKPIDRKLKNTHKKIGSTVSKAEQGVASTLKDNVKKLNDNKFFQKMKQKNKEMNDKAN
tara:strand:+ start:376 stop:714 length:339 start_codon:yes stop_codon:yes gene_type:complete